MQVCNEFVLSDDTVIWGDLEITGTLSASSIPMTTRYYSIPRCAWQPYLATYYYVRCHYTYTPTDGETVWFAPVNLPHGAVVTELRAWLYDAETTEDINVTLVRHTGESYESMASVSSSGSSISFVQYADSSIDYETVDNSNYAYFLDGWLRSGDDRHKLGNVRITYTVTETLP